MMTISVFEPQIAYDAKHDLGDGDIAVHILVKGKSPEHDPINFRVILHNPSPQVLSALALLGLPRVDDFATKAGSKSRDG